MRKLLITIPIVVCLAALLGFWVRPEPVPVELVAVERGEVETLVANTRAGTLKACRRAHLSFKSGGQVSELLIHAGQRVQAGDVLMRLRQDDLEARVAEAFGVRSFRVTDPGKLEETLKQALAYGGPTLVDVVCQPLHEAKAPVSEWVA